MDDDDHDNEVLDMRTGRDRRRRRRRSNKIRFRRTMLKSLICCISSTGA
jgi:hypothetical protein